MVCRNQLKLPGVIFFNIDSYPPIHAFNCSQACFLDFSQVSLLTKQVSKLTCVLNARLKQVFPFLSLALTTRLGAEPSAGAGLHHFLQSSSSSRWLM